jgi:hypothetical protein
MNISRTLLLLPLIAGPASLFSAPYDVEPVAKRAVSIRQAETLYSSTEAVALPAEMKHPFFPGTLDSSASASTAVSKTKSDSAILETIASKLSVSGTLVLGDQQYLLIRQKKLKVGDRLKITLDDRDYEILMTAITRNSYTLRLNETELSLPIVTKPESRNEN